MGIVSLNTSFKRAAIEILKQERKPLHYRKITKLALGRKELDSGGKTPEATMGTTIRNNMKEMGEESDFIQPDYKGSGIYQLNPSKYPEDATQQEANNLNNKEEINLDAKAMLISDEKTSFEKAAIEILKQERKPLHYKEITALALERKELVSKGETPWETMGTRIRNNMEKKGEESDFIQPDWKGPGYYQLNPSKYPEYVPQQEANNLNNKEEINLGANYMKQAGEHIVCGELLFRGLMASITGVDTSIDILAIQRNKFLGIQVSTSNVLKNSTYIFEITQIPSEKTISHSFFYVLVLLNYRENHNHFLIFPFKEIDSMILKKLPSTNYDNHYRIEVKIRDGRIYLISGPNETNEQHEVSNYLNNWDLII